MATDVLHQLQRHEHIQDKIQISGEATSPRVQQNHGGQAGASRVECRGQVSFSRRLMQEFPLKIAYHFCCYFLLFFLVVVVSAGVVAVVDIAVVVVNAAVVVSFLLVLLLLLLLVSLIFLFFFVIVAICCCHCCHWTIYKYCFQLFQLFKRIHTNVFLSSSWGRQ